MPEKAPGKLEKAAMIKEFREAAALTRKQLAAILGLDGVTAIYAWERGAYEPSAEVYVKLAVSGSRLEWKYTEWFLARAGLDDRTLEQMADRLRPMPPGFVGVRSLGDELEEVPFPKSLLGNWGSTRFTRVHQDDETRLRPGDILLIDTSETALRKLEEGSLVAVSSVSTDYTGSEPRKSRFRLIGFLQKQNADAGGFSGFHFMLEIGGAHQFVEQAPSRPRAADIPNAPELHRRAATVFLGSSVGDTEDLLHEDLTVLGRVVAWISSGMEPRHEQEHKGNPK